MKRETDLQNINKTENKNLQESMKRFAKEVYFYNEIEKLFSISGKKVPDEYSIIVTLFQICHHNLIFSFINLLRTHFVEPSMVSRKSIEAVGQATIIFENPDFYSSIWCKGESEGKKEKKEQSLFENTFKRDKFRNCKNKDELRKCYNLFSSFSHVNVTAGMHRTKRTERQISFGYFDTEVDSINAWMTRYLNYTIVAYFLILEDFSNIFGNKFSISKERINELKHEHRQYMETKISLINRL